MTALYILLGILAVLFLLYLLSVKGRTGHEGLKALSGWNYAHRGLHDDALPENSLGAFKAALDCGYGIELDVHLLADGNLAVMHDSSLKRTAGCDKNIEDLTLPELKNYRLNKTEETIPDFRSVVEMYADKAPMVIELKVAKGNYAALCETACRLVDEYPELTYCMESFDPRAVLWLKKNRPEIVRGQLTENYFKTGNQLHPALKLLLTHQMGNFLTKPDFVAYRCTDRHTFSNWVARKLWGMQGVTWTLKTRAEFDNAVQEGWIPIFENFKP